MTERGDLQVAMIQMVSGGEVTANLSRAGILLQQAAEQDVQLVVLPENFACFGLESFSLQEQIAIGEQAMAFLSERARVLQLWIVGGSVPAKDESGRLCAASLLYRPDGGLHAHYEKLHLFDVQVGDEQGAYRESATYAYGSRVVCADIDGCRTGLTICYDLRFPELYRLLAKQGAELLLVPSAFTHRTGKAHWEILLRARAIENLCWVVAPNQGGVHDNGRRTWGHSMIVDPWGQVVAQTSEGEAVCCYGIDLQQVRRRRADMPVLDHARLRIEAP